MINKKIYKLTKSTSAIYVNVPAAIAKIHVRAPSFSDILTPMKKPTKAVQAENKLKRSALRIVKPDSIKIIISPRRKINTQI